MEFEWFYNSMIANMCAPNVNAEQGLICKPDIVFIILIWGEFHY